MIIDWQMLVLKLRSHGVSCSKIARDLKLDYQHILRLSTGDVQQPRFNSGVRLLDYAYDLLPENEFLGCRHD